MVSTEAQLRAAVRCSIILAGGDDSSRLGAYLRRLGETGVSADYECIIIKNQGLEINERQLTEFLPRFRILGHTEALTQQQLFDRAAMAASGRFLLFVKNLITFDMLALEEAIKDLEASPEKVSISANKNFVLVERLYYASGGGFEALFRGLDSSIKGASRSSQADMASDISGPELMFTGERQVGKILSDIEQRHRLRYTFAAFYIDCFEKFQNKQILLADIGCGVGYGSYILARMLSGKIRHIYAFDIDEPSITFANRYYDDGKISYCVQDCGPKALLQNPIFRQNRFDVITSFEFLEHIDFEQSKNLLDLLLIKSDLLLASLPIDSDSKYHKFRVSNVSAENYFGDGVARCPVRKKIMHKFLQNGTYFVIAIKTA